MLNNEESNKSDKIESSELIIKKMLREAGITDFDPVVIHQLLYFMYDHVTTVLENAMIFSEHANKSEMDNSDIMLALKIQRENESTPVSRNINTELANEKNSVPLPEIKQQDGIRLPPERYCLSSVNYMLKNQPKISPVPVVIPKQFIQNMSYMIPACNNNPRTVLVPACNNNLRTVVVPACNDNIIQRTVVIPPYNDNNSRTILKRSRLSNIPEQRIVFKPSLKINIKQAENDYQIVKKQRTNN